MAIATTTTAPTTRPATPLEQALLSKGYQDTLQRFLGTPEAVGALIAEVFTQARKTLKLYDCTVDSIRFTIAHIAALQLNPALPNEVFLIPRKGEMTSQYGYAGLRKLALRSPEVVDCFTREVCVNDFYESPATLVSLPTHRLPGRFAPRGRVEGYYAVVQLHNGNWRTLQMSVRDVEAHAKQYVRDMSQAPAWQKGTRPDIEDGLCPFDKMALKTCLRMLLNGRDIPLSSEVQQALLQDVAADVTETPAQTQGYDREGHRPAALGMGSGGTLASLVTDLSGDREAVAVTQDRFRYPAHGSLSHGPEGAKVPPSPSGEPSTSQGGDPALAGHPERKTSAQGSAWRDTIEAHLIDTDMLRGIVPADVYEACLVAYHNPAFPDAQGLALAGAVLDTVNRRAEALIP